MLILRSWETSFQEGHSGNRPHSPDTLTMETHTGLPVEIWRKYRARVICRLGSNQQRPEESQTDDQAIRVPKATTQPYWVTFTVNSIAGDASTGRCRGQFLVSGRNLAVRLFACLGKLSRSGGFKLQGSKFFSIFNEPSLESENVSEIYPRDQNQT